MDFWMVGDNIYSQEWDKDNDGLDQNLVLNLIVYMIGFKDTIILMIRPNKFWI